MITIQQLRSASRLAVIIPLIALAACGDDEPDGAADTTATTAPRTAPSTPPAAGATTAPANGTPDEGSTAEPAAFTPDPALADFCAIATELVEQDGPPTSEQLAGYQAAAPDDIADPVALIVTAFEAADGDFGAVFADGAAVAAIGEIEAFEAEACGLGSASDPSVTEIDPEATLIDVAAKDYEFEFEPPTSAGRYSFVMTNGGTEVHLMVLVQLEEGVDIDEVIASEGEAGVVASFESEIAAPGSTAVVTADLAPGRWVIVCPVPNAEGTQHHELGMVSEFVVG